MDFAAAVKYLDRTLVRKPTLVEASSAQPPFDKFYSFDCVRAVKKLPYNLTLPARSFTYAVADAYHYPRVLFQYNVTLPEDAYILGFNSKFPVNSGSLCVKWRVGTTVHRYRITGHTGRLNAGNNIWVPDYVNQKIGRYCCFEYWFCGRYGTALVAAGLPRGFQLRLNLLKNPADADEQEWSSEAAQPWIFINLGHGKPINLPADNTLMAYVDNPV